MKYATGICAICGADDGLHQSETNICPKYGREETNPSLPQRWGDTVFVDSGIKKLEDAAPDLLESLEMLYNSIKLFSPESVDIIQMKRAEQAIKHAKGK